MMEQTSIFHASGEACSICEAMDGWEVPEGFEPHPGCTCHTTAVAVTHELGDCEWEFHSDSISPGGIAGIEVTVTCADGSVLAESVEFDTNPYNRSTMSGGDDMADALVDAAEDAASELCGECEPPEPFIHC